MHGRIRELLDPRFEEAPIGADIVQSFLVSTLADTSNRFHLFDVAPQDLNSPNV